MKNFDLDDDTFLARWIEGTLTPDELTAFQQTTAYKEYQKIKDGVEMYEAPTLDKEKLYQKIEKEKTNLAAPKTILLFPKWAYGIAASIAVLIGVYYFTNSQPTTHTTGYGEQLALSLPDGSSVLLNSNSSLSYLKKNWDQDRSVQLEGEAFFKVNKGIEFHITTSTGTVQVLGTAFSVFAREAYFETKCYEGKVKATSIHNNTAILTKGEAFREVNSKTENYDLLEQKPSWLEGETSFVNAPLEQVMIALESQFNIKIKAGDAQDYSALRYTGSFSNTDLKIALKTVFSPLQISYSIEKSSTIVLKKM